MFGLKKENSKKNDQKISAAEEAQQEILAEEKNDMIQGVEELAVTTVKEVMVPRIDVDFISMETPEEEDDTPQVSVINTNKFSTMNLQEELAKGLQMILAQVEEENEELPAEETPDTQEFIPVKEVVIAREEPAV